jgi:mono/diheme cytochrome c family protein
MIRRVFALSVLALLMVAVAFAGERRRSVAPNSHPTYSKEIVRIFQDHCQSCHHPGGIGPFSLTTYETTKPKAALIRFMTSMRRMPPVRLVEGCGDFANANHLAPAEINAIATWVQNGAPEGNRADLPKPLSFDDRGWSLGEPDIISTLPKPYLGHTAGDTFRMFPMPTYFDRDTYVTGVEIRPGSRYVHHVAVMTDSTGAAERLDAQDEEPGYFIGGDFGFAASAFIGTWTPGQPAFKLPDGYAFFIPAGSRLVMDLHVREIDGHIDPDQTQIGIYLAHGPVQKLVKYDSVDNSTFIVPAGNPNYTVTQTWKTDHDIHIVGIGAHAHRTAHTFDATATFPDGSKHCLLKIDDWDWQWQGLYPYVTPVAIPAGSRIDMVVTYDNSESNPAQFHSPPIDLPYGGSGTDNEMCRVYFNYTRDDELVANAAAEPPKSLPVACH